MRYEHFVVDITTAALHEMAVAIEHHITVASVSERIGVELTNIVNEIRSRLQRHARGE